MPLAIGSRSDGAQVAGDAYGPVLSSLELNRSALCSAQDSAPSTADLTLCTTSSRTLVADSVPSSASANVVVGIDGVERCSVTAGDCPPFCS